MRLGQAHSCVLVLLGVRLDGTKELIALAEWLRESTESWADLLRDCRRRGMRDPELVVADGAMGLWKALVEVFLRPGTSAAGFIKPGTSRMLCRRRHSRAQRR
jgi:transposase-like protein